MVEETKVTATGVHSGDVGTAGHPAPLPLRKGSPFQDYAKSDAVKTLPSNQPSLTQILARVDTLQTLVIQLHAEVLLHQNRIENLLEKLNK